MMRLDKFLKECGVASRSESKRILKDGDIKVNGNVVKDSSTKVDENKDVITYKEQILKYEEFIYIMINKPSGVVSATEDKKDTTVLDLLKEYKHKNLFPFGRLDKDSVGLIILSNNGKLAHELLSDKKHVEKEYFLCLKGRLTEDDIKAFSNGISLEDDYVCKSAKLEIIKSEEISECLVTISEGKYHQLKRMFKALGKEVIYLKRIRFANVILDPLLKEGEYRLLTNEEVASLINR